MYPTPWLNNINRSDILPPMTVSKKVKDSDKWKMAVLDSFEHIGLIQFRENLKFWDYYRMKDGKMSFQELKEVSPQLENIQQLLDGVGIPTFLKHYDLLGTIVNALEGKLLDVQDKFNIIDTGEVAQNEVLRFKNEQIIKMLQEVIDTEVKRHLAERGMQPDGQQFSSPEEQQAFLQELEQVKQKYTPKGAKNSQKVSFKSNGLRWAEATKEKDTEEFDIPKHKRKEFVDKLLTGRCFREYKVSYQNYYINTWSPKNTFFSKEIESEFIQDGEYVGRIQFYTPSECIKYHGHEIPADKQKELLGGNENWKNFVGDGIFSGTIEQAIQTNFGRVTEVPFDGYVDYNFFLGLQDTLGIPMGESTFFRKDGTQENYQRYLPRMQNRNAGSYNMYASILRDDFQHRRDLCQVTEVYFIAYDLWGYLTYEDPETGRIVTEEVTEDILPNLLKERNIKADFKTSLVDIVKSFEVNTLKWVYRPVCYEAVKIQSGNLNSPIYLYCRPTEHQIRGTHDFDIKLPVSGMVGQALAPKIMPYQAGYNLCMNQMYNLLEKELGMFFLMDIGWIPSDIEGWGDAEEALVHMRNIAKEIGFMPVQTMGDNQKPATTFNQISTYNISAAPQIQTRLQMAEMFRQKAYDVIGINPQMFMQSTKYETAEGIRVNQEANFTQIANIYDDFDKYEKRTWELHLSVAQYCQTNKKDLSVMYTKSDGSLVFLQMTDPEFPLRRFGILPSKDSKKKKELESIKQYLMSTNTIQEDLLDVARLMTSDTMTEILEIAQKAREERMLQEQLKHERDKELIDRQAEANNTLEEQRQAREDARAEKANQTKVIVAQVTAKGRAADKQADMQSFEEIDRTSQNALKEMSEENKIKMHEDKLQVQKESMMDKRKLEWEKLNLKAKEIEARVKISENQKTNSMINKN